MRNGYLAIGSGGGIQNRGVLTLMHCAIMDNHAGTGGGIANWLVGKVLLLDGSVVSGNTAQYSGGGIAGDAVVTDSTIRDNTAPMGGGIDGGATITGSTISNNTAEYGSAIRNFYEHGPLAITNSTISGNRGNGSVIHVGNLSVPARLTNVTIAGNESGIDAISQSFSRGSIVTLHNAILANANANCGGGDIRSEDYNLVSDTSCNFRQNHDQLGIDPMLGPLADNGGITLTRAPLSASSAIAGGQCIGSQNAGLITIDQRGMGRPQSSACTIGAYEANPT